jgi:hypothetical protein
MKSADHSTGNVGWFTTLLTIAALVAAPYAWAQGTAFTYQGQLDDSGYVAQGAYDMEFKIYDAVSGGSQIGVTETVIAVPVNDGLFSVELDFGAGIFTGPERWLEIGVQTNGGSGFTTLSPRTKFTSTPYTIAAISAQSAASVAAGSIGSTEVANNSLTASDLGPNSVGSSEVIDNSLTANDLAANSVGASEIASGAVGQSEIATGGVASSEVQDNSLTAGDLAADSVTASEIAANSVGNSEMANNAVGSAEVIDGSLLGSDLDDNTVGSSQLADSINLGSAGIDGELNLYSSSGGGYSIKLDGGDTYGGRLWLFSNDGQNGVWMGGGSGDAGKINVYNTNAAARVEIDGFGDNGGGTASFDAADGSLSVKIYGENASGAGQVSVNDAGGDEVCRVAGDAYGGEIRLYDDAGATTVVIDSSSAGGGFATWYQADGQNGLFVDGDSSGAGLMYVYNAAGSARITLDGDVGGDGRITCDELQIRGGSDLSEQFDIDSAPAPGSVVCIDPDNPGKLMVSSKAYDRTVAGIVSGAGGVKPGMMMGQNDTVADGEYPVALTGRVYCMVDASPAAIQPGDLITTSSLPGHGMKVLDHSKAQGAIIGKAMTPLAEGQGIVLVLVSLQ